MEQEELETRFTYHPPKSDLQKQQYEDIRGAALGIAEWLNNVLPESREKSLAIRRLEEVVFWANAALARRS